MHFSQKVVGVTLRDHYNLTELIHSRTTVETLSIVISICLRLPVREIKIEIVFTCTHLKNQKHLAFDTMMKLVVQNMKLYYLLHVIDWVKHKAHSIFLSAIAPS